jgi:nitroimidazol reductase NimA-like FMN-containing flavoprotein (pyridoxamine 5'-phosphate oxidase superfamily)
MLEEMKRLAKENDICVLATVAGGKPHCSLMSYVTDDDCREIYMTTRKDTRKYKSLMENPAVSLLIDTREKHSGPHRAEAKAMTVSGTYSKMEDENKRDMVSARLLARHPHLKEFLDHPDSELLCIKITSFLLLNGLTDSYFEEV